MLEIAGLARTYAGRRGSAPVAALGGVSLSVARGDLFALLGPSGCGKTTLLQSIAGLEAPDAGRIAIAGTPIFDAAAGIEVPANRRAIGMVFQSYAIWPHMSVFENVAFPLVHGTRPRPAPAEVRRRVLDALGVVKLAELADRPAPHLSGGQQQRVALARAIVAEPRLLLLDEPLSNLDARLREEMRIELRQLVKAVGITAIFVTHDQVEAMGIADRIALMQAGRIIALGAPDDIYFHPPDEFAASFMGQGNVLTGRIVDRGGLHVVETPAGDLAAPPAAAALARGGAVTVIIRPHAFALVDPATPDRTGLLRGALLRDSLLGEFRELEVRVREATLRVHVGAFDRRDIGAAVALDVPADRMIVLPAAATTGPAR